MSRYQAGQQIGNWTLVECVEVLRQAGFKRVEVWKCKCKCGAEKVVKPRNISPRAKGCNKCRSHSEEQAVAKARKVYAAVYDSPLDPELMALARKCWR